MLVLYVKQIWVAFTLFNHALQVSAIKYLAKPLSTFHQINAYEEDGFLIIDMCASDDGQAINNYNVQNLRKSGEALDEVSRLSSPKTGEIQVERLSWFWFSHTSVCLFVKADSVFTFLPSGV